LYHALSKAKNEREYRKIAREHWLKFKKEYKASLAEYKQQQFVQKFVKENKKYNIYLPDFNQEQQKTVNVEEDEAKMKELMNEDEEIFNMIDKIMTGAVYQKWKSLQDKDI
jgi:DNA transposition AAA+ family ATPase